MTVKEDKLGSVAKFIRGITFKPEDVCDPSELNAVVCMRTKNVQTDLDTRDLIAVPSGFVRRNEQYLGCQSWATKPQQEALFRSCVETEIAWPLVTFTIG
jgi:hypothetical protein